MAVVVVVEEVAEAVGVESDRSECLATIFLMHCLSDIFIMLFTQILNIFVLQVYNFNCLKLLLFLAISLV